MNDLFVLELEPTVVLRPGIEISLEALRLGWSLEARGVQMRVDGSELVVRPKQLLTADDVARLKRHAPALKRLLRHGLEVMA